MQRVFIIEDQPSDLKVVADVVASLGVNEVEARNSATSAKLYLQSVLDGEKPMPDLIVLDLDLGYESGFELLRFWHGDPRLSQVRLIVWTVMGDEQRDICALFKVHSVVAKLDGPAALKRAIENHP